MALVHAEVDFSKIVVDPNFNPRFYDYIYNGLDHLQESIAQIGLVQPITVQQIGKVFYLIDGYARYLACKALGYQTMRCQVIDNLIEGAIDTMLYIRGERSKEEDES
jgi:ParB-like chromosome segregation protein Spo0J